MSRRGGGGGGMRGSTVVVKIHLKAWMSLSVSDKVQHQIVMYIPSCVVSPGVIAACLYLIEFQCNPTTQHRGLTSWKVNKLKSPASNIFTTIGYHWMSFLKLLYDCTCLMGYHYLWAGLHQIGLTWECTLTGSPPRWLRVHPQPDIAADDRARWSCLIWAWQGWRAIEQLVPLFSSY